MKRENSIVEDIMLTLVDTLEEMKVNQKELVEECLSYKNQLEDSNVTTRRLRDDISKMQERWDELVDDRDQLNIDIGELTNDLDIRQNEVYDLDNQLGELRNKNNNLKSTCREYENVITKLESKVKDLQVENQNYKIHEECEF